MKHSTKVEHCLEHCFLFWSQASSKVLRAQDHCTKMWSSWMSSKDNSTKKKKNSHCAFSFLHCLVSTLISSQWHSWWSTSLLERTWLQFGWLSLMKKEPEDIIFNQYFKRCPYLLEPDRSRQWLCESQIWSMGQQSSSRCHHWGVASSLPKSRQKLEHHLWHSWLQTHPASHAHFLDRI